MIRSLRDRGTQQSAYTGAGAGTNRRRGLPYWAQRSLDYSGWQKREKAIEEQKGAGHPPCEPPHH
jgi:hypothetical protein